MCSQMFMPLACLKLPQKFAVVVGGVCGWWCWKQLYCSSLVQILKLGQIWTKWVFLHNQVRSFSFLPHPAIFYYTRGLCMTTPLNKRGFHQSSNEFRILVSGFESSGSKLVSFIFIHSKFQYLTISRKNTGHRDQYNLRRLAAHWVLEVWLVVSSCPDIFQCFLAANRVSFAVPM